MKKKHLTCCEKQHEKDHRRPSPHLVEDDAANQEAGKIPYVTEGYNKAQTFYGNAEPVTEQGRENSSHRITGSQNNHQ
jgi:hypothetical protein